MIFSVETPPIGLVVYSLSCCEKRPHLPIFYFLHFVSFRVGNQWICAPSLAVPTLYSVYVFLSEVRGVACHFIPLLFPAGGRRVLLMDLWPVAGRPAVPTLYSVYAFLFEVRGVAYHFIPL